MVVRFRVSKFRELPNPKPQTQALQGRVAVGNHPDSATTRIQVTLPGTTPAQVRVLGGSWVVIIMVTSRVTILITHIRGLTTPLISTHEPPSRV